MNNTLLSEISSGKELKHAETADKSAPIIAGDVKIKTVDRKGFLAEVAQPHDLKHAETADKSAPVIGKPNRPSKHLLSFFL